MKMHPEPKRRHKQYVEPFSLGCEYAADMPYSYHIVFTRERDDATQRCVMTKEEAFQLYKELAVMLRYEDTPAKDVEPKDWEEFHDVLKGVISGQY